MPRHAFCTHETLNTLAKLEHNIALVQPDCQVQQYRHPHAPLPLRSPPQKMKSTGSNWHQAASSTCSAAATCPPNPAHSWASSSPKRMLGSATMSRTETTLSPEL